MSSRPLQTPLTMATASPEEIFEQLTLDEKISLLSGKSMWTLRDIERSGVSIPSIRVSDGPQGVRKAVTELTAIESFPATCFPTACALACSWNKNLLRQVGQALAKECRQQEVNILLGPGLNLKRHPCGGRNFEYFSEDPVVSGHMAAAMVDGIQSSGHVGACIKHVCVNNQESWRFRVNVLVDERTLRELYLKGFEYVVKQSKPWTMMCAYNQVNGIYCSENEWLFQEVVRKEWGYQGHVLTDWGATNRRAVGIEAGIDLEMPGTFGIHNNLIKAALKDESLSQDKFDEAVLRNLRLVHRAVNGMENGDNTGQHEMPTFGEILYENHHELAYQAALDCVVLLQNNDNLLPLTSKDSGDNTKPTKVALIGDFCQDPRYQGMGSSKVHSTKVDTVLEHIAKHTDQFTYSRGYRNSDEDAVEELSSPLDLGKLLKIATSSGDDKKALAAAQKNQLVEEAVQNAKEAEAVIIMAGVPEIHESEGFDREHLNLPAQHNDLIEKVCSVNSNVIVVLSNGGPVVMPWKDKVKAIVECYLLGQAGARALLDILFGVVSPSGKLTETFPVSMNDVPSNKYFPGNSHTVEYREGLNIGYRYYDTAKVTVLFPFGHGLSYTSFSYTDCTCKVAAKQQDGNTLVQVQCTVTNDGTKAGAEIVQIYVHHRNSGKCVYHPEQQLQEFQKTNVLEPGQSEQLVFNLTEQAFATYDGGVSEWILEAGTTYEIRIASSSRDVRWTGTVDSSVIEEAGNCKIKIAEPSEDAQISHPRLGRYKDDGLPCPLTVSDEIFHAMLDQHPHELMHLSSRSLLGHSYSQQSSLLACKSMPEVEDDDPSARLLPHDISVIHRNSFLAEIEMNGCFGALFTKIIVKAMESEMEDPNDPRQRKMIREVAMNLPLRCLATFSRGSMSFDLLDSLISFFNGHYIGSIGHFSSSAGKSAKGLVLRR